MNLPVMLVVSRDPSVVAFFKRAFKAAYQIFDTENPISALEHMQYTPIDLLIFDEKTADLDFYRQIRQMPHYENVPILLITSNLKKDFINRALNAGISDFLHFPLDPKEVDQRVAVAIKAHEVRKKMATLPQQIKRSLTPTASLKKRFLINDAALKEIIKAKDSKSSANILMIEVDNFSEMVDRWDSTIFSEILLTLTSFLNSKLRKLDMLFPQGSGRFVLLLPKTSQRAGMAIAETLRKEVSGTSFIAKKMPVYLTVSIGLVSFNEKKAGDDFDRLLTNVTSALLEAKKKGNRVVSQF